MARYDDSEREVDIDALFRKDAFRDLDPEQLKVFRAFASEIAGKNSVEIAALFIQYMRKLPKSRPISGPERDVMVRAIADSLPETDRRKMESILKMLDTSG